MKRLSKSLKTKLDQLKYNVDVVYGYGSLELIVFEENDITPQEIADKYGWKFKVGAMTVSFYGDIYKDMCPELEFGHRPDAKTMRKLVNESKKHEKDSSKAKNTP